MFERYTESARQVVVLAQDEARQLKHAYIGTEHILLGLTRQEDSLAAVVLTSLGIESAGVREFVSQVVGLGEDPQPVGQLPFTPRSKKALELGLREALSLGHNYISTEHVLLGLVRENEGVAAQYLIGQNVSAEDVRNEVVRRLTGRRTTKPEPRSLTQLAEAVEIARDRYAKAASALDAAVDALRKATDEAAA